MRLPRLPFGARRRVRLQREARRRALLDAADEASRHAQMYEIAAKKGESPGPAEILSSMMVVAANIAQELRRMAEEPGP